MKSVRLVFKKIGNHWYLDINHHNPQDLILDRKIELFLNKLDIYNEHIVNNIWLYEQGDYIIKEGLVQFSDEDMTRYFTTEDDFTMRIYIDKYEFTLTSRLYNLLELNYQLDLHESVYRITLDEI